MDRLNFNHFFYFHVVAKEGSIKEAAEKLHVSQPTISDQIKLLEEHFDCKLFERRHRGLYLTKQGELALNYSEKTFSMASELTSRLRNQMHLPKKDLDIGISQLMSPYFLYETLRPLFKQTEVSVRVREAERHRLIADLEAGVIDLVFTDSRENISAQVKAFQIGKNRTYAVAHRKYLKYKKKFPEKLNSIPFFNYTSDSPLKYKIELFFIKYGLSPKTIGEADDVDMLRLVTEEERAFTILPEAAKNQFCRNKDLVVLGELKELQTEVWGLIRSNDEGLGYQLVSGRLK